eukprot:gnl/TRDRNA2_/TRDRNA2_171194_c0_seq1.p1 gnl/TRDRNA2_/TRDRNA2_171194_c0~~gnl/TRDRNA2_/TRDRNA2_171194_c0_seq1.p1  ORF type:complete len:585 (+),score=71.43 gnl/TRDRNA2_/TRDRNA2_171194_c0_seq1:44-1798(+)
MSEQDGSVQTLIFLDVDGVLNVGIQDPGQRPLSFNEANASVARKFEDRSNMSARKRAANKSAETFLSVMRSRSGDGDSSLYGEFFSRADIDICNIFTCRLAQIIRAAGAMRRVVLSSSWRRPKYEQRIHSLEQIIGGFLGQDFMFDDRTALADEVGGGDRLRLIGDYVAKYCSEGRSKTGIRVLVLDDFFFLPITDFDCGSGTTVNSVQSAESYLEARASSATEAKARIIHTYGTCLLPSGDTVRVGTGLSLPHFRNAITFVDLSCSDRNPCRSDVGPEGATNNTVEKVLGTVDSVETLIFVDIAGVLHIGIREPGKPQVALNEANVSIVQKFEQEDGNAQTLLSVMRSQTCDGDSSTYGNFLSRADIDICDIFVQRLVEIIRAAGKNRRVILSASWRRAKHASKIQLLEQIISGCLGQDFTFDDRTSLADEATGGDRLRLIGDYIAEHCRTVQGKTRIKVLVLDDFFFCPISDFDCSNGNIVNSLESAEIYLEAAASSTTEVEARIIHTYSTCALASGVVVHVGTGLSLQHLRRALAFVDLGSPVESTAASARMPPASTAVSPPQPSLLCRCFPALKPRATSK